MTDTWSARDDSAVTQYVKLAAAVAGPAGVELAGIVEMAVKTIRAIVGDYQKIHELATDWSDVKSDLAAAIGEVQNMAGALGQYWTDGAADSYHNWLGNAKSVLTDFKDSVIGNAEGSNKGVLSELENLGSGIIEVVKAFTKATEDCLIALQENVGKLGADAVKIAGDAVEIDAEKIADAGGDAVKSSVEELIKFEKAIFSAANKLLTTYNQMVKEVDNIYSNMSGAVAIQGGYA
ncbi:WXG100 family type VII secretion target [Amycolatopsis taiwanensis]|uniref:Uncharacterized protein n=1 Tax=Amycolatopsis taiwanensis TaxID=342230 RepID=A0A9W6QXQ8_9PSEU|nr:hypothetical protein [Amycolatopsis taiwanensis]GLY65489.1 hypothetical protein Atai01_21080 [Amycolatopsis taiwanensis]